MGFKIDVNKVLDKMVFNERANEVASDSQALRESVYRLSTMKNGLDVDEQTEIFFKEFTKRAILGEIPLTDVEYSVTLLSLIYLVNTFENTSGIMSTIGFADDEFVVILAFTTLGAKFENFTANYPGLAYEDFREAPLERIRTLNLTPQIRSDVKELFLSTLNRVR